MLKFPYILVDFGHWLVPLLGHNNSGFKTQGNKNRHLILEALHQKLFTNAMCHLACWIILHSLIFCIFLFYSKSEVGFYPRIKIILTPKEKALVFQHKSTVGKCIRTQGEQWLLGKEALSLLHVSGYFLDTKETCIVNIGDILTFRRPQTYTVAALCFWTDVKQ